MSFLSSLSAGQAASAVSQESVQAATISVLSTALSQSAALIARLLNSLTDNDIYRHTISKISKSTTAGAAAVAAESKSKSIDFDLTMQSKNVDANMKKMNSAQRDLMNKHIGEIAKVLIPKDATDEDKHCLNIAISYQYLLVQRT